jgi:hypothetical protein
MTWPVEVLVRSYLLVYFGQPFHASDPAHGIQEVLYRSGRFKNDDPFGFGTLDIGLYSTGSVSERPFESL